MIMKKIVEYAAKKPKRKLFQTRVAIDLLEKVRLQLEKDGMHWRDLIECSFRRYLEEAKQK